MSNKEATIKAEKEVMTPVFPSGGMGKGCPPAVKGETNVNKFTSERNVEGGAAKGDSSSCVVVDEDLVSESKLSLFCQQ
jgi:hypothetical protein